MGKPLLSKAIIIPEDLMADTPQIQKLALYFEQIVVWPLCRNELPRDDLLRVRNDLDYLRDEGIAKRAGAQLPVTPIIRGYKNGPVQTGMEDSELLFTIEQIISGPRNAEPDITDADHGRNYRIQKR